uniref:Nuclear nucleic acid-binding protein C1D n=1 Tax=Henneguya salminicola TaxID=69463 RepID=A0A6G3MIJ2_HENSL
MDLEEELLEIYKNLDNNLDEALKNLENFLKTDYDQILSSLNPVSRAKFELLLAYIMSSIYSIFLKLEGTDTGTHPVKEELNRIRKGMQKQKDIEEKIKKGVPKLVKDVAGRMLRHSLSEERNNESKNS